MDNSMEKNNSKNESENTQEGGISGGLILAMFLVVFALVAMLKDYKKEQGLNGAESGKFSWGWETVNVNGNPRSITDEEYTYLTMLVCCEAGYEPYEGKVAVAACALNRLDEGMGGNTLTDVIFSPGVFSCIWDWQFHLGNVPYDYYGILYDTAVDVQEAEKAVDAALAGNDPTRSKLGGGALYYYNPDACDDYENSIRSNLSKTCRIGNHVFYRVWD